MNTKTATMTTQQVADRLTTLCRKGEFTEAVKELYAPHVVSHEPEGGQGPARTEGHANVLNKTVQFGESIQEVHANHIGDPIVADDHFAVTMDMDVTMKGMGRTRMKEIAVYQVQDGKIVRDQFFYRPMPAPGSN